MTSTQVYILVPVFALRGRLGSGCAVGLSQDAFHVLELNRGVPDLEARAQ